MKWTQLGLALASMVLAVVSWQEPMRAQGSKWWNLDHYKQKLGLNPDQSRRMEKIFQRNQPRLSEELKVLGDAEQRLEQLYSRSDKNAVIEQVRRVEAARGALSETRAIMLLEMRDQLSTDQWIKLGDIHRANDAAIQTCKNKALLGAKNETGKNEPGKSEAGKR